MKNKCTEELFDLNNPAIQAFNNWAINTKKIELHELKDTVGNRLLLAEYYLVLKYLSRKITDPEYQNKGIYNYSDQVFNELLHFVAYDQTFCKYPNNYQIVTSIIKDCLAAGHKFGDKNYYGSTALELAMSINNHSFLKAMKDQGYDFGALDKYGLLPINFFIAQIAEGMSTINDLKIWIENGLSIDGIAKTSIGLLSSYDFALDNGLQEVALLLKEHGVSSINNKVIDRSAADKILPEEYQEALKEYFMKFYNCDNNLDSLFKIIQNSKGGSYTSDDFLKDFKNKEKLGDFSNFVQNSENLDSTILKYFEKLVEEAEKSSNVLPVQNNIDYNKQLDDLTKELETTNLSKKDNIGLTGDSSIDDSSIVENNDKDIV